MSSLISPGGRSRRRITMPGTRRIHLPDTSSYLLVSLINAGKANRLGRARCWRPRRFRVPLFACAVGREIFLRASDCSKKKQKNSFSWHPSLVTRLCFRLYVFVSSTYLLDVESDHDLGVIPGFSGIRVGLSTVRATSRRRRVPPADHATTSFGCRGCRVDLISLGELGLRTVLPPRSYWSRPALTERPARDVQSQSSYSSYRYGGPEYSPWPPTTTGVLPQSRSRRSLRWSSGSYCPTDASCSSVPRSPPAGG